MDSRVILKRVQPAHAITLPELKRLRRLKPTLTAASAVVHRASVSLVIPTYHNADLKRDSLRHVLSGVGRSQAICEVVLVSSGGAAADRRRLPPLGRHQKRRICHAQPEQRGGSRNLGAAAARSDYLLFMDDDMLVKDWRCVDSIVSETIAHGCDCALFPRRQYARFPLLYDDRALRATIDQWRADAANGAIHDPLRNGTTDLPMLFCFPGCFMLIKRKAFERMGGFDARYRGWGFEDTEFGVRALRRLRVLNLFHRADPLLHIDHPVSPYKSEEHGANYRKFFASANAVDVHRFCRTVLLQPELAKQKEPMLRPSIHAETFAAVAQAGVPLQAAEVEPWAAQIAEKRMHALLQPRPEFVVLHGSRATGRAGPDSDYDLLALYRGAIQEFFVTGGKPRVEIECADLEIFYAIARQPWVVGLHGVMELAKIAQAKLLWGHSRAWHSWRSRLFKQAAANGLLYWRALTIGLRLHQAKYGIMLARFTGSLNAVLLAAGLPEAAHEILGGAEESFVEHTAVLLDAQRPGWRAAVKRGETVFELQIPEVWSALHLLAGRAPVAPGRVVNAVRPMAALRA